MVMTTRRTFMVGCSAAIAAMAGSRLSFAAFGDPGDRDVLVVIFLRGGADGLSIVAPTDGADRGHYETARPDLKLPVSGDGALLPLDAQFGLAAAAAPLHNLYQAGKLSIVHAAGLSYDTRSHFDAQEYIELGTPGIRSTSSGWLTRHLATTDGIPAEVLFPSLAVGTTQPSSLRSDRRTVAMENPDKFSFGTGPWKWRDAQRLALRRLCDAGSTAVHIAGSRTLDGVDLIETFAGDDVEPANGADYPDGGFGRHMRLIAGMIKLDVGLRVATVDLGGWDTHESQSWGPVNGRFPNLLNDLAAGLEALYTDLDGSGADAKAKRLTVVVQSEFGRRFRENENRGTDHGHGNVMLIVSGAARGGLHGPWPGLAPDQLYDHADLDVATDYRQVLSEILVRRLGNPNLSRIFPGYSGYAPLGLVDGTDLAPI